MRACGEQAIFRLERGAFSVKHIIAPPHLCRMIIGEQAVFTSSHHASGQELWRTLFGGGMYISAAMPVGQGEQNYCRIVGVDDTRAIGARPRLAHDGRQRRVCCLQAVASVWRPSLTIFACYWDAPDGPRFRGIRRQTRPVAGRNSGWLWLPASILWRKRLTLSARLLGEPSGTTGGLGYRYGATRVIVGFR